MSRRLRSGEGDADMRGPWMFELRRLIVFLAGGYALGWLVVAPHLGMAIALLMLFSMHTVQLLRLTRWTQQPEHHPLPDVRGIWGEIFDALHETRRKARNRKRRLAAILREFQASTAALPDGAVVITAKGDIAWFNRAAQSLLGLRSPQDVGTRVANLVRDPAFAQLLSGELEQEDLQLRSPQNRDFTLSLRLIPYGSGQQLLIARDVSEAQRVDRMRRDFVANASHELRTPLTVLAGYIDMMRPEAERAGSEMQAWETPLEEMRRQLTRMEALLADLLKLARLEAETPAGFNEISDIPGIIDDCLDQARQLSPGSHDFVTRVDRELRLSGRAQILHSIVINLLSNAVRYSPHGGAITLIWERASNGDALLSVSDEGIGIPAEVIPRLTERFYRVDEGRSRASGGTGLGLAIVRHALELHDAGLDISSVPGEGSRFLCRFPAARVNDGSTAAVATSRDAD